MATSKYFKGAASTRMATRQSPPPEDSQQQHHTSSETKDLLTEISKMNTTLQGVASDVSKIKETTNELKISVKAIQERLEETESRISVVEDATAQLTSDGEKHGKSIDILWKRVEDLENRSRRNNVRLVGLKEGREGGEGLVKYIQGVLADGLGMELDGELEIERAHRSLIPRPSEDRPPRMVLIRFLRSAAREKVLRAAREKGPLEWEGCKLSFFPDMSRELAEKRKAFNTAKKLLRERGVRYALVYPATLKFSWKGQSKNFHVSSEAEDFIRQQTMHWCNLT
ncbi:hypothetical protein NFI96_001044 [Prochilodus magdalenae]|nr:hypothetical protein NFI96_001044 [Prochilodus magdalenae]